MDICPQDVEFLVPVDEPTATYNIIFEGRTIQNNNSTWCYSVSVTGAPGLSHWVLGVFELCSELLEEKLLAVTRNGVELQKNVNFIIGNSDGVSGIKFEVGTEADESPVQYCITLDGVYTSTPVDVAVKGGPTPAQKIDDALCGPSCEAINPTEIIINDLLESIALEETSISHLINAEAEKIQWAVGTLENQPDEGLNADEILAIQDSAINVIRSAIKYQMLLQFKLDDIKKIIEEQTD